jgi:hypothetical protein
MSAFYYLLMDIQANNCRPPNNIYLDNPTIEVVRKSDVQSLRYSQMQRASAMKKSKMS